jgi:hypothetical protein
VGEECCGKIKGREGVSGEGEEERMDRGGAEAAAKSKEGRRGRKRRRPNVLIR